MVARPRTMLSLRRVQWGKVKAGSLHDKPASRPAAAIHVLHHNFSLCAFSKPVNGTRQLAGRQLQVLMLCTTRQWPPTPELPLLPPSTHHPTQTCMRTLPPCRSGRPCSCRASSWSSHAGSPCRGPAARRIAHSFLERCGRQRMQRCCSLLRTQRPSFHCTPTQSPTCPRICCALKPQPSWPKVPT